MKSLPINLIRKYLKLKIIEDTTTFRGHEAECKHVYDLMKKAVVHGESHSALIFGPGGAGKSALVNSVLDQLSKELDLDNDAHIVRLSGLMHYDDKVALKAITTQMQLENAVGDRVFGSFSENLAFLLSCLQSGADRQCKSMIFILEQFEMFCHSGRTQTLLYNLFDITHSGQAPVCVIGLTQRDDVMDLLEKRVKSRFSHRHIHLFRDESSSPWQQSARVLTTLLSVPACLARSSPVTPRKGRRKSAVTKMEVDGDDGFSIPEAVLRRCKVDTAQFSNLKRSDIEDWNAHIQALTREDKVIDALDKLCYYTVTEQSLRDVLLQIVSNLSPTKPYIDAGDISSTIDKLVDADHRVELLQSLSILELSLVIAMKHGMDIFDGQPMNFEMVLHRYTKFATTNSSAQSVPRPVILKAFEHLQALEIVVPARGESGQGDSAACRAQREYQLCALAVPPCALARAVKGFRALPTEIEHWLNNTVG